MKKIGVLTFHRADNYGATLQAYALQKVILENDFNCEIIDYRNPKFEAHFQNKSLKRKVINSIKFFLYHKYYSDTKAKNIKFTNFRKKHFIISEHYKNADVFSNEYTAVIVGSDQVWNVKLTDNDYTFFLPYRHGAKKLSYAASFGTSSFNDNDSLKMKQYIEQFDSLLVREEDGIKFLSKMTDKLVNKVLDPTLLVREEQWLKISKPFKNINEKYILLYLVADQKNAINIAKKIAHEKSLKIYYLDAGRFKIDGIINIKDVGPDEFICLIKNATYVITTSFHGLIFSLNFNTPFLFEMNHKSVNANSRLIEVMNTFRLEKYLIQSDDLIEYLNLSYNWENINQLIDLEREKSKQLLLNSLRSL